MKFEIKVIIMSIVFSLICMFIFTYASSFTQKSMYAYQVGIYKEAANKDAKLSELKESDIEGYCYEKDGQYYVLSMISEDRKKVEKQAIDIKGIMKTYIVSADTTIELLLENLSKGVIHD